MGPSMLPNFNADGTIILVDHISPRMGALKPGDVVTAVSVRNPNLIICKRILGMEGDKIKVLPPTNRETTKHVTVICGVLPLFLSAALVLLAWCALLVEGNWV
jgi:inner membrane protease subunit 1